MNFYKTKTDEKQIEKSNIQLNIKIIVLLVLKENAFNMDVQFQISRNFNLSLCLNDDHAKTIDTRKLQYICLLRKSICFHLVLFP